MAAPDFHLPDWPIFVVSLADARLRRERITRQCAALGLSPVIVDATDGRNGLPPEAEIQVDRAAADARARRRVTDAELACALSHHGIYHLIVEQDLPGAIVLEDDAILTALFAEFMRGKGYLASDFVQMDHMDARVWYRHRKAWSDTITLLPLAANASLTTGYSLSQMAARFILDRSTPVAGLADWPCDMIPLGGVVTWPRIVDHPPVGIADSAIEAGRKAVVDLMPTPKDRATRFFRASYWQRWWFKRRTRKIS